MLLRITGVENPTDVEDNAEVEKIYFRARAGANLHDYLLYDATFTDDDTVSNRGRHIYRFPNFVIEENCNIVLWIAKGPRMGDPTTFGRGKNRTVGHRFYWNRTGPVINNTGDTLTLIRIADERPFDVPAS